MEPAAVTRQLRMDSSSSSCSNRTRSIASLGGSEDSILEERASYQTPQSVTSRQLSDGFSPDEQDNGFTSNTQLESPPNNGSLRCRTPERKVVRGPEEADDVWLPRFPRARRYGGDRSLGTSGSTDSWIENSVSEEEEDNEDGDITRCLTSMSMGSGVIKVKGSGRCAVKTLYLDGNKSCIRWRPSKKGNKAKISIDSIKELRRGPNTDTFKRYLATGTKCHTKNCFSIIHGSSWDTFDLISDTEEEITIWVKGLKHLIKGVRTEGRRVNNSKLRDCWLKATFEAADKSGDGLLSMDEVLKLLHKLNVNLSKRKVKQLFREADSQDDNVGQLDFDEFIQFYRTISTRQEVDLLLRDYGHTKGYMTLEEFARYLKEEQGVEDVELDMCQELVRTYEPIPENAKNGWLGIDGFTRYLLSHEGDIFNPVHREVNQDMTHPLTHYYIASSHNTYLVGDQLMSQSSVDVYALVLQAGCRCVEMDCWDGKDGEPIIYHGYTLTSKIKFHNVISIISKYAFVTSPYPVILSIENHCSLEQQKKMAQYLVEILGDMLHVPSTDPNRTTLPSPEELKGKILIKAKKLPKDHNENLEAGEVSEEDSADELDDDLKLERSSTTKKFETVAMAQLMLMRKKPITPTRSAWQRIVSKVREDSREKDGNSRNHSRSSSLSGTLRRLKLSKKKPKSQSSSESSEGGSLDLLEKPATDEELAGDQSTTGYPKAPSPLPAVRSRKGKSIVLSRQLSELVQFTRSVGFRGFKGAMPSWELPSLGEIRASNLVATKAPDFTQFTGNHLCRVYPSAYRIDSSNYNPQPMWNCGCQLVALNYQTEGRAMQLSRAKFSQNGNCGYVLKYPLLCDESKMFDPNSGDPVSHLPKKQLTLHIISGQQLPKPPQSLLGERGEIIDPYVEVEVIGLPVDCAKSQTKTIQDNGFNPFWDCTMTFTLHLPEMAMIRFAVWDEDPIGRDFIGQASFPVSSLMPGYRHVHLEGLDQATLFVHVVLEDYNTWVNNTARFKPRGSQCRTKSVELEYSPLSSSPTHRYSPRRKSSLGLVQKLNMRRRHSMAALPPRELSPLPVGTRMKRRSYEDGNVAGSTGELSPEEEHSEFYLELALTSTDSAVDMIVDSAVQTDLEADGTFCISVDDLPDVLALNIPTSAVLEAVREQRLSLRSEASYTAVERCFMYRYLSEENLMNNLQKCETESSTSSVNYEQFVQDAFEDCFSPELSFDPCPDLLKEASPSLDKSSDSLDSPTSENASTFDDQSTELPSISESTECSGNCSDSVNGSKEVSEEESDDVFLPDASKREESSSHKAITKPVPIEIPKLSSASSPPVSPISPTSSQPCTFSRGTVERRSRIIYDDTGEFLEPCLDSKNKLVSDEPDCLDPKPVDTGTVSENLCHEFNGKLDKCQVDIQSCKNLDDTITNEDDIAKPTTDSNNSTFEREPDVITSSLKAVSLPSIIADEICSISDDSESCDDHIDSDMLSVSCDDAISDISGTDYESDASSELLKSSSQLAKVSNLTSEERDTATIVLDKLNLVQEIQTNTIPKYAQNVSCHPEDLSNRRNSNSNTSNVDLVDIKSCNVITDAGPISMNDKNNNDKIVNQLKDQEHWERKSAKIQEHTQAEEDTLRCSGVVKDSVTRQPHRVDNGAALSSDDSDDNSDDYSDRDDIDDTSSSASSSSIASSISSTDTVVEVSRAALASDIPPSSTKNSASLSPLKLEDIFDPSECQQFRSELVHHWQKNNYEEDSVCEPNSHSSDGKCQPPTEPSFPYSKYVYGPKPYSQKVQAVSSNVKFRQMSSRTPLSGDSYKKRLSWPLRSAGKIASTERVSDLGRESAHRGNPENASSEKSLQSGKRSKLGSILDSRFMLRPAGRDEDDRLDSSSINRHQGKNGLREPLHQDQEVIYRSHLKHVKLSNPSNSQMTTPDESFSTSPLAPSNTQIPPSYHSLVKGYTKSQPEPSNLTRSPHDQCFKQPPSYEDHISKYGLPSGYESSSSLKDDPKQMPSSIKRWHAEPVTISKIRTVQLHSAQDMVQMKQTLPDLEVSTDKPGTVKESESHPPAAETDSAEDQTNLESDPKHGVRTASFPPVSNSKTFQCLPTPPRRRKRPQRSYSADDGSSLINDRLLRNGKRWVQNSGRNHNVYLMLTL